MTARAPLPRPFDTATFTTKDAVARGITASRLRAADLDSRYRGVRIPRHDAPLIDLCRARALLFPSDAFISGLTAARLRRVPLPRDVEESRVIDVTVPEGRRALVGHGVRGHAARVADGDVVDWLGLRISSAPRTWCELGAVLSVADLVAAGDYLVHRNLPHTSIAALECAVSSFAGRRGSRRLRSALVMLDDNSASRKESHLRVLAIEQGLAGFATNLEIRTSSGFRYFGDLAFPRERVIVEYQSEYHFDHVQQRKDMTRRSRLEADGWAVMLVNSEDLLNPVELAARIRAVMALHSRRFAGGHR